ncbi:hypothetical protein Tsubulata_029843 [Turnera subulata]|uniref:Reticulon-like protein n=1 Tax=Turnera subulata TaxID=218843 RepID=A0A9Q0FFC9_9ROSI|nr:hypothetical protein Tsubulata_029843 [Turnera subulata]
MSSGSSLHDLFGGGKVADIFLWENKLTSAIVLAASTLVWGVFELADCHLVTLVSGLLIASLCILFVWSMGTSSGLIKWEHPTFDEIELQESHFTFLHEQINELLLWLYNIATEPNVKELVVVCKSTCPEKLL